MTSAPHVSLCDLVSRSQPSPLSAPCVADEVAAATGVGSRAESFVIANGSAAAARRVQAHRARARLGFRCLTVRVGDREIRHLISRGYLSLENREVKAAVAIALDENNHSGAGGTFENFKPSRFRGAEPSDFSYWSPKSSLRHVPSPGWRSEGPDEKYRKTVLSVYSIPSEPEEAEKACQIPIPSRPDP
jgi:hypothetical protein